MSVEVPRSRSHGRAGHAVVQQRRHHVHEGGAQARRGGSVVFLGDATMRDALVELATKADRATGFTR